MLRSVVVFGLVGCAGAVAAEPVKVTGEGIRKEFVGALIGIDTPIGTTIPVRISRDGLLAGKAGALAPMLGSAKDRGRWWIERDQLCMKWFRWFDAKPRCITLRRDDKRLYWHEASGESGTATLLEPPKSPAAPAVSVAKVAPRREPSHSHATAVAAATMAVPAPEMVAAPVPTPEPAPVAQEAAALQEAAVVRESATAAAAMIGAPGASAPAPEPEATASAPAEEPRKVRFATAMLAALLPGPQKTVEPSMLGVGTPEETKTEAVASGAAVLTAAPAQQQPQAEAPQAHPEIKAPRPTAAARHARTAPSKAVRLAESFRAEIPSFRVVNVEGEDMLNVRAGPSEEHEPVGVIPSQGRGIHIIGECYDEWCPIRHSRLEGWVNRSFLLEEAHLRR